MTPQEIIKLIAAFAGFLCIAFGIKALFSGIRAEGEVDLSGLVKGKVKTGSAGVLLLFFGTIILVSLIFKGAHVEYKRIGDKTIYKSSDVPK